VLLTLSQKFFEKRSLRVLAHWPNLMIVGPLRDTVHIIARHHNAWARDEISETG
jgi:hypothetical protein